MMFVSDYPIDLQHWLANTHQCEEWFSQHGYSLLSADEIKKAHSPSPYDFENDESYHATVDALSQILFIAKNKQGVNFGYALYTGLELPKCPVISQSSKGHLYLEAGTLIEAFIFSEAEKKKAPFQQLQQELEHYGFHISTFEKIDKASRIIDEIHIDPDDYINALTEGRDLKHLYHEVRDEEFEEWQTPRYGVENPTLIKSLVLNNFIYSKDDAYTNSNKFNSPYAAPTWCFSRFGQSLTRINGVEIYIGGEHEDYYDPDFYIYNDVVVIHPDDHIDIYHYPKETFPPTDFHTATLINKHTIIIIGGLGYPEDRMYSITPLFILDLKTFRMRRVLSKGNPPGWIYKHRSLFNANTSTIKVWDGRLQDGYDIENIDEWELDVQTWEWKQLTDRKWKMWSFHRKDNTNNELWSIRQALFSLQHEPEKAAEKIKDVQERLHYDVEVTKIESLYHFDQIPFFQEIPYDYDSTHRAQIQGVLIRFKETSYGIDTVIEGELDDKIVDMIQSTLIDKLFELEHQPYVIRALNY